MPDLTEKYLINPVISLAKGMRVMFAGRDIIVTISEATRHHGGRYWQVRGTYRNQYGQLCHVACIGEPSSRIQIVG